ncbi:MAG: 16S rRNA (cytosine(1402)-N(4))-methyltransferase RsmH [Anaerolineaceae bacterium]
MKLADQIYPHIPVLNREVLAYLKPVRDGKYLDATLGAGGHAEAILIASQPSGLLIGLDIDQNAVAIASERLQKFSSRATFFNVSYIQMKDCLRKMGWSSVDGILFDLGVSSMQVDAADRGFSFNKEGPLDMRFDDHSDFSAYDLINHWNEEEIASILWNFGEEPKARAIAKAICIARPLKTTTQLAQVVLSAYHGSHSKIHPATRTFQAVRIAVNRELTVLEEGINLGIKQLGNGGLIAVISFHSLEDRIVKDIFKRESKDCICPPEQPVCTCDHKASLKILTKKPVIASDEEIKINPRSRSAKLRVAQKIG